MADIILNGKFIILGGKQITLARNRLFTSDRTLRLALPPGTTVIADIKPLSQSKK